MEDRFAKRAGRVARYAHASVYPVVAQRFTWIPAEERQIFAERAIAAVCSGNEPYGISMFAPPLPFTNHE